MKTNLKDPSNWIPKEIFQAYCGANSERLSTFYDKAVSKKNMMSWSINWLAILILPAWFGYRRQWVLLGIYTGLLLIFLSLEAFFHFHIPNSAFSGATLAMGFMANGLLLSSANQIYFKLRKKGFDETAITEKMKNRAQGSVGRAIAALVGFLAFIMAFSYIEEVFILRS
jgi:uncharacterized protein DUF2628